MRFPTLYVRPGSDQPALKCSLIRAFASRLNILWLLSLLTKHHLKFLSLKGGCTGSYESTLVKMPHCWKSHVMAHMRKVPLKACTSSYLVGLEVLMLVWASIYCHTLCLGEAKALARLHKLIWAFGAEWYNKYLNLICWLIYRNCKPVVDFNAAAL